MLFSKYCYETTRRYFLVILISVEAKYFSMIFYSTPGASHLDQMSQVIRYVKMREHGPEITEKFIRFSMADRKLLGNVKSTTLVQMKFSLPFCHWGDDKKTKKFWKIKIAMLKDLRRKVSLKSILKKLCKNIEESMYVYNKASIKFSV